MAADQDKTKALRALQEQRADRALADYRFDDNPDPLADYRSDEETVVVNSEEWEVATFDGKDDWTKVLYVHFAHEGPDAEPRKVSFHAAFYEGSQELMEAYAYSCDSGAEIGYSIQETFKARVVNGDFWAIDDQPQVFPSLADAVVAAEKFLSDTDEARMDYDHDDIEFVAESGRVLSFESALDELALNGPDAFPGQVIDYNIDGMKGYCVAISATNLMRDHAGGTSVFECKKDALAGYMGTLPADSKPVMYQVTDMAGQVFCVSAPCADFTPEVVSAILSSNGAKLGSFTLESVAPDSQAEPAPFRPQYKLPHQIDDLIEISKKLAAPVKKSPGMSM